MKIISDQVLKYLPLSAEPLLSWAEDTDLHRFLLELYSVEGTIVMADSHKETVNYADFGHDVYLHGRRSVRN
jgi:hypothetical protein